MAYTPSMNRLVLPDIKNASALYLAIYGMAEGDIIDVNRTDLPRGYGSVKTLVARITRSHKQFYAINRLLNPAGWRIIRVNNLENSYNVNIFKSKNKQMENNQLVRDYKMSDAALAQRVDEVLLSATSQLVLLTPRGVTATRLTAFTAANAAFKLLDDDVQLLGRVGQSVGIRQTSYVTLTDKIGNLRTMVQNVYGADSYIYSTFKFEGMISLGDTDLISLSYRLRREAALAATDLAPEGWTATFETDFIAAIVDFDTKRDAVNTAENNRHKAAIIRINAGNIIYAELEKICNTGKDVFRMLNVAIHDEFVIYDTPSGGPTPTPTIVNFTIPMGGYTVLLNQPYNGDLQFEVKNNSSASCKLFLSVDGLTPFGITVSVPPNSTVTKKYSDLSASGNYLVLANEDMMLSVNGVFTYPV